MFILKQLSFVITMIGVILLTSCGGSSSTNSQNPQQKKSTVTKLADTFQLSSRYRVSLEELSPQEYKHNPNQGRKSQYHGLLDYDALQIKHKKGTKFDLVFTPGNDSTSRLIVNEVDLTTYIPTAPSWVKTDSYLTYISFINQEWNRQQVHYPQKGQQFTIKGDGLDQKYVSRVDIARNCLNAGLWEAIFYSRENGQEKPVYHGWFDFPRALYDTLFEHQNQIAYEAYSKPMEHWVEPENKKANLSKLRTVQKTWKDVSYTNLNDKLYPLTGARAKKHQNIIYPENPDQIQDFLTDSTRFANFDQPGYYNKNNPRKTQLGRLANLENVIVRKIKTPTERQSYELEFLYTHRKTGDTTRLVIGGFDVNRIPQVTVQHHNQGLKLPMGIGLHSFYENYQTAVKNPMGRNPYYGLLLTADGKWLDSHNVGIDGPLMHWDKEDPSVLHFWILSFERHAFVGHYTIEIPDRQGTPSA